MLNLKARVHFHEIKRVILIQIFKRTCTAVTDRLCSVARHFGHLFTNSLFNARRGSLLNNFLMTALQRTIAIAQRNDVAVTVGQNLGAVIVAISTMNLPDQCIPKSYAIAVNADIYLVALPMHLL